MIKVRNLVAFGNMKKGDVWSPDSAMFRDRLIRQGLVEVLKDTEQPISEPIERAIVHTHETQTIQAKRGPGRPRKGE